MNGNWRFGLGWDAHPFGVNKPLILGGVTIPEAPGLEGYSDGDVLLHAIGDALLGAAGLGDLGEHFPEGDLQWKDADSRQLIAIIMEKIRKVMPSFRVYQCDATLLTSHPRLAPHRQAICRNLANLLACPYEAISLKFGSNNRLGFIGRGEGVGALALCVLVQT